MQYYYGNKTPLRVLDEIEFWKHQEGEHTVVIRQIAENLEESFVEELKEWEQAFAQTEAVAVRYIEAVIRSKRGISPALLENIRKFTVYAKNQSLSFVAFLNQLAAESEAIRNNPVAGVVINHIRRESEYLIGIITAALKYF
ncbi:MAG: DUF2935 domain-containing protein [Syntrophomonadaceae bacterium]|nr:DUF2935 domain-containing protein [Syntrophomonadaceae bacterium]